MPTLELDDIQGLVARGYAQLPFASYVLARIGSSAAARPWLAHLVDQVTAVPVGASQWAMNVAFTASGLAALGLPATVLRVFSNEFVSGMTTPHRRRMLGDMGANAPEQWLWGGPTTDRVDVLLLLFARDAATLAERYAALRAGFGDGGLVDVYKLDSLFDLGGREHFGFTDGISQPIVEGLSSRVGSPSNTIRAGEIVLGYPNEYGRYTERPTLKPEADPQHLLPPDPSGSGDVDLGRNGTYLVFRHLSQDVRGFWQFVEAASHLSDGQPDPGRGTWLASRMIGRWSSGAPLALTPDRDDPSLASANDFMYHGSDVDGLKCPIGAHVRRAHPRDSLDPQPGSSSSIAIDKRHRLLRRGREYGPPVAPSPEASVDGAPPVDDADRGLYFVCLNGNIARQFEFIQHTWLNNPKFDGLYADPDPLVSPHAGSDAVFTVQADPVRVRFTNLPQFVRVRGGSYFFMPGLRALRYLSTLGGSD